MKSIHTPEYQAFLKAMIAARKQAGVTQQQLADALRRPQSFVAKYEKGERRLDVIEFLEIMDVLKTDYQTIIEQIQLA